MLNQKQQHPSSSTTITNGKSSTSMSLTSIPSSSISYHHSQKISPSTLQQVITHLKRQVRDLKVQRQQQKINHQQQLTSYTKEIESLKKKILVINQKQYLKSILTQELQEEKIKHISFQNNYKKLKVFAEKQQMDIQNKHEMIQAMKQQIMSLKNDHSILQRQKQKHLELSIVEKINLQQRIAILQQQVQSKQKFINALKSNSQQTTSKQIKLKKLQRKLIKKLTQAQQYEKQVKNLKQFESQKLKRKVQMLEKENKFLKEHLNKVEERFSDGNGCICESKECKKQLDMFKNKYINKSRELSKVKIEMSKEMFKEQFMKEINGKTEARGNSRDNRDHIDNKQNALGSTVELSSSSSFARRRGSQNNYNLSTGKFASNKKYKYSEEFSNNKGLRFNDSDNQDQILFNLTQNDQEVNQQNFKKAPSYGQSKYSSLADTIKSNAKMNMRRL